MFGKKLDEEILQYALENPDREICGFVIDGKVSVKENTHNDPENFFSIDGAIPKGVQAIFHSHPEGPFYPSDSDMEQQLATDVPWGIACFNDLHKEVFWFGEGCEIPQLVGRSFRHGVTDCYNLIRDFYKVQYNIDIPTFPRSWEWWTEGKDSPNFYETKLEEAGFSREVVKVEVLPGDVFLANIRSSVPNHGGVYLGNGLILHHTCGRGGYDPSRLSVIEPIARWSNLISKVVRHENSDIDRSIVKTVR